MPCNCHGKNRAKAPSTDKQRPTSIVPPKQQSRPAPAPVMGSTGRTQTFVLTDASGRTQSFGSRLEANAAAIRQGGEVSARA